MTFVIASQTNNEGRTKFSRTCQISGFTYSRIPNGAIFQQHFFQLIPPKFLGPLRGPFFCVKLRAGMRLGLIDDIYASSFAPELWPRVMDELSRMTHARGGVLFAASAKGLNWTSSERVRDDMAAYATQGWLTRASDRRARLLALRHSGFLVEGDIYTREELERDPTFSEFLRPRGLGWTVSTCLTLPTGDELFICLNRDYARGPVEKTYVDRLDELRPHLARGALMAARLHLTRARIASETLALIGLPALVLDQKGKIIAANHLIEDMSAHIRWRAFDSLTLADPIADRMLRDAIAAINMDRHTAPRSFPVRGERSEARLVAHLIPIRGVARDILTRCAATLILTPLGAPMAPDEALVQSLFDLTPAEARVARGLSVGRSVEEIAARSATSRNTVRAQVRGVLEKTGCSRQAEAVALLVGIAAATPKLPAE